MPLKFLLLFTSFIFSGQLKAQKIKSIHVHLYTDSLKKGTYNYINIDGKLSNGRYLPLDSTSITFKASDGKFTGNDLFIPANFLKDSIVIKTSLKSDSSICQIFTVYIKKLPDPPLETEKQVLENMKTRKRKKKD